MIQTALSYTNSIVFVGELFPVDLFDGDALFDGQPDRANQLRVGGQLLQYSYKNNTCKFTVMQNRIDVAYIGPLVLPQFLIESAEKVAGVIDSSRRMVQVSGIGLNCDAVFSGQSIQARGDTFSAKLVRPQLAKLVGATPGQKPSLSMTKIIFVDNTVNYTVRIEPDFASQGENLFVATNGHQNVSGSDLISPKLGHVNKFKSYVQNFHQRIITGGGV